MQRRDTFWRDSLCLYLHEGCPPERLAVEVYPGFNLMPLAIRAQPTRSRETSPLNPTLKTMAREFFTLQPVKPKDFADIA
jgi:hypothetical protein